MILINPSSIHEHLARMNFTKPYELHCVPSIDSTNQFLNHLPPQQLLRFCCAEEQTAGRGRFGRQWNSPFGENIYLSGRWPLQSTLAQLSGLSLVIGLAMIKSLKQHVVDEAIQLKWPNDLFWQDQKLGGILIDLNGEQHGIVDVTIGIGLNINTARISRSLSDKPWCSLLDITGKTFDRNTLIADLIVSVDHTLDQFLTLGFTSFQSSWDKVDYLKDQWICVSQPTGQLRGIAQGVNAQGHLCLRDINNTLHDVASGEASLS